MPVISDGTGSGYAARVDENNMLVSHDSETYSEVVEIRRELAEVKKMLMDFIEMRQDKEPRERLLRKLKI